MTKTCRGCRFCVFQHDNNTLWCTLNSAVIRIQSACPDWEEDD